MFTLATASILIAGCSNESSRVDCRTGADSPNEAVKLFLTDVKNGDREAALNLLTPGGTISDSSWKALGERLQSEKIEELRLIEESETPDSYGVRVLDSNDRYLESFALTQVASQNKCFSVNWGDYIQEEPMESQSTSINS